jgi:hypothetical protein
MVRKEDKRKRVEGAKEGTYSRKREEEKKADRGHEKGD